MVLSFIFFGESTIFDVLDIDHGMKDFPVRDIFSLFYLFFLLFSGMDSFIEAIFGSDRLNFHRNAVSADDNNSMTRSSQFA